ncbi:hypothetical protein EHQ68_09240 [Leptospira congkakensis]|uniref:Uncharacterized protein n=1 Tax=Leptospira congkakensis TaxID=2484932 RepID=A0A4Z1AJR7_9LEPT|nr:hypothetical protein [Leptospira congkakensis]TGL88808.1 hypothetical protein EHQ69_15310 [Leptospira congkakensis]TGL89394.1 hypothetical protein EHQ68_09240 [Leptospira congkakensis]TGL97362.1 hypothetical protein EHQ70_08735 [Leptospira congkakensis]
MEKRFGTWAEILDITILIGAVIVLVAWVLGFPLFYLTDGPVMSIFTAISLLVIVGLRLATRHFHLWPFTANLALLMIVGGGNISSMLMLLSAPAVHINPKSTLVMTSVFTSVGLVFFSVYEILLYLRKTPNSVWILDDILIHLALVPGGLSLIGHIFQNPTYLSMSIDPRVGVSPLEMVFMATLVLSTLLSNPNLFLWKFLKGGLTNQLTFLGLFINQYIAPIIYLEFAGFGRHTAVFGPELFIFLGGVIATLGFLLLQAQQERN